MKLKIKAKNSKLVCISHFLFCNLLKKKKKLNQKE